MYSSRYRLDNGEISIGVDSMTGEILEFINLKTGENFLKNSMLMVRQPFCLTADSLGSKLELHCGTTSQAIVNPALKAKIVIERGEDEKRLIVKYTKLTDDEVLYDIGVTYTVVLPFSGQESYWYINIENKSELIISKVKFPCINGIYLGNTWQDNSLVYPFNAGVKIDNPVKYFSDEPKKIDWRWQEYRYTYLIDSFPHNVDETGLCSVESKYSGPLSMRWMDLFHNNQGLYFASHDSSSDISALRVETYGEKNPGLNFSTIYYTDIKKDGSYHSPQHVVAIHDGDWHAGADKYRDFKKSCDQYDGLTPPSWFLNSPGLVAHYDFKYQNGGIVHGFSDLPKIYSEAKEMGINHLLLSGWHKDGFDNGFPEYTPDPDLGTEDELKGHVEDIIKDNGHICFYINSRLANRKFKHLQEFIEKNEIANRERIKYIEQYGDTRLEFACMCAGSEEWQDKIADTVSYLTKEVGLDGIYLDQLGMAPPSLCFNSQHNHEFNYWNEGYKDMLSKIIDEHTGEPISIIYEGVSDIHGRNASGQLISTFAYHHTGAFPEMYKYTFPNQILVDMLYPYKFQAMRPVHIGMASTDIINRAFVTGSYYWIYDLEEDNTFFLDETQYAYLKECISLRQIWLDSYGHGSFVDNRGIWGFIDDDVMVKRFDYDTGILLACANKNNKKDGCIKIDLPESIKSSSVTVTITTSNGHNSYKEVLTAKNRCADISIPEACLSILYIEGETKS